MSSSSKYVWLADEEDEEDEEDEAPEQEPDIFELEGQTEQLQLDPSKVQERQEGDVAIERLTGRGGFEGEAVEAQPSTSGRPEVCVVINACPIPLMGVWRFCELLLCCLECHYILL